MAASGIAQQCLFQNDSFSPETASFLSELMPSLPLQLPEWPDTSRALPNEVVRSALFNIGNRNQPRRHFKNEELASLGNGVIKYTGEELRQDDEIVWLHILNLVKQHKLGQCVEFLPYRFLKDIGWPTNGGGAERLRNCLLRMSVTGLTVSSKRIGAAINVSLIRKFKWIDEYTNQPYRQWHVWLEPEIVALFDPSFTTHLNWETRKKLPSGIATKLFSYWSSHKTPFPEKISNLMTVCAAKMSAKHFKAELKTALQHLKDNGFLADYSISGTDVVSVIRS